MRAALFLLAAVHTVAAQSFIGDCATLTAFWTAAAPALSPPPWSLPGATTCCFFTTVDVSVACSSSGTVTSFIANNQQLSGSLAPLATLSELALLNLANNAFTGEIPAALLSLPSLTSINFSGNQLSGQVPLVTRLTLMSCDFTGNTLCGSLVGVCLTDPLTPCTTTILGTTLLTTTDFLTTTDIPTTIQTTTLAPTISLAASETVAPSLTSPNVVSSIAVQDNQPNAVSNNLGAIIGGSVGGALLLAVIIAGIIFQNARKRESRKPMTSMASAATWNRVRPQNQDVEDGNYDENAAGPAGVAHYSMQSENTATQSTPEMRPLVENNRGSVDSFDESRGNSRSAQ